MNIQDDLFDSMEGISRERRVTIEKMKVLSEAKYMRGSKGKEMWEAHVKKIGELFEEIEID